MTAGVSSAVFRSTHSRTEQHGFFTTTASTGTVRSHVTPCRDRDYPRWEVAQLPELSSLTYEDISWAYSPSFVAKVSRALQAAEQGDYKSFRTIDELIDYLNETAKKATEKHT